MFDSDKNSEQNNANIKKPNAVKQEQKFYVLNGQQQLFQIPQYSQSVVPHQIPQQFVPQLALRSAIPEDPNLLFFQSPSGLQQSNLKNSGVRIQNQEIYTPQNLVLLKSIPEQNPEKDADVRPIR